MTKRPTDFTVPVKRHLSERQLERIDTNSRRMMNSVIQFANSNGIVEGDATSMELLVREVFAIVTSSVVDGSPKMFADGETEKIRQLASAAIAQMIEVQP